MATVTKRKWKTAKGEPREAWVLAFTDAKGDRHKEQFSKKRDADARRVQVEGQVSKGTFRAEASKTTVADACELYLADLALRNARGERVKMQYLKTNEGQLRNYVIAEPGRSVDFANGIGHIKLSQLSAGMVSDLRDDLRNSGVGVVTTRRILANLSRVLKYAVSKDLVSTNVAHGVQVTGRADEGTKKVFPPSKKDIGLTIHEADADFAFKMKFAAASGLRASELHALCWKHIDFDRRHVLVKQSVDQYRNVDGTKTKAGSREVPLAASMLTGLREWRLRSEFSADNDLVFPNTVGKFVGHTNLLKRQFNPLLARTAAKHKGFKKFTWHGLRHFAISTWIEAGLQPKTVQTFAGHSTITVTMDRYGHLFKKDEHNDVMDRIADEIFA